MVGATVSGGSATYAYDADGRRIKQTASGVITNYLWDETSAYGDVLVESDNSNAIKTSYTLGNGELISQKRASATSPEYFLKDGQESVRNLTDNTGNLESGQNYTYDAFGNLTSGQTSPASNYLYTGQQFDVLTGLYDLRARYYRPSDGRFLSGDAWPTYLKNPIELNRYVYTANDPINRVDPSGYFSNSYAAPLQFISLPNIPTTYFLGAIVVALGLIGALIALNILADTATPPPPHNGDNDKGSNNYTRPLTSEDFGLEPGSLKQLDGTFSVEGQTVKVRVDMIEGDVDPTKGFNMIKSITEKARATGATELRLEGTLANERLEFILKQRYNFVTEGPNEYLVIPL